MQLFFPQSANTSETTCFWVLEHFLSLHNFGSASHILSLCCLFPSRLCISQLFPWTLTRLYAIFERRTSTIKAFHYLARACMSLASDPVKPVASMFVGKKCLSGLIFAQNAVRCLILVSRARYLETDKSVHFGLSSSLFPRLCHYGGPACWIDRVKWQHASNQGLKGTAQCLAKVCARVFPLFFCLSNIFLWNVET